MKRNSLRVLGLLLVVTLFCSMALASSLAETAPENEAELEAWITAPSANPDKVIFRFASTDKNLTSHPNSRAHMEFMKVLKEELGDQIEISWYLNGALGSTTDAVLGGLQIGAFEGTAWACGSYAELTKAFTPFDVAYLFPNVEAVYQAITGEAGKLMKEACIADTGINPIALTLIGMRDTTNSRKSVHVPADMAGMKIRVQNNNMFIKLMGAFGATGSPVAFAELFTALQQKVVDGQENPILTIVSLGYGEVQDYLTLTQHTCNVTTFAINDMWLKGQSEEVQAAFAKAAATTEEYCYQICTAAEAVALEGMKATGEWKEIYEPTAEEMQLWIDAGKAIWPDLIEFIGQEYFNQIANAVGITY